MFNSKKYLMIFITTFMLITSSLSRAADAPASTETLFINLGTAGITGVYYPVGAAICKLTQREAQQEGKKITCSPEATGGSIFNLNALANGNINVAIVQSDWQATAYNGAGLFADKGPNNKLRTLFSMQEETYTIIARKDANITKWEDLRDKRLNIGAPGSGESVNTRALMNLYGWKDSDFALVSELKASEHAEALCDNRIDAFVYVVGNPNASIQEAATTCDVVVVPITGPQIDKMVADNPYYTKAQVPGGIYRGNPNPTDTFGVKAVLTATTDLPDDVAYIIAKGVFENLEQLKKVHQTLNKLTAEGMLQGFTAPIHPGALKYYKERGLIKE